MRYLALSEIVFILHVLSEDGVFTPGNIVCKQVNGCPMGNGLSPTLCQSDLEIGWEKFKNNFPTFIQQRKWSNKCQKLDRVICGALHVDDQLLGSTQLCPMCLSDVPSFVYEKEILVECEGTHVDTYTWQFLLMKNITRSLDGVCSPYVANTKFVLGSTPTPEKSSLAPFANKHWKNVSNLESFMFSHLHVATPIFQHHDYIRASQWPQDHVIECLLMGRPSRWIARVLIKSAAQTDLYFQRYVKQKAHVYVSSKLRSSHVMNIFSLRNMMITLGCPSTHDS